MSQVLNNDGSNVDSTRDFAFHAGLQTAKPFKLYTQWWWFARQSYMDFKANFWDPNTTQNNVNMPRIRPTHGDNADTWGLPDNTLTQPSWWEMQTGLNYMYNMWKSAVNYGDPIQHEIKAKIVLQANYLANVYTASQLGSDGSTDGTINAADDASWKLTTLMQLHEVTGDDKWLGYLRSAFLAIMNRYADPFGQSTLAGSFSFPTYGMPYKTTVGDNNRDVSTTYDAWAAIAAIYLQEFTNDTSFIIYAKAVAATLKQYQKCSSGTYFGTLVINPSGTPRGYNGANEAHLTIDGSYFGQPQIGCTNQHFGALFAIGVLNARLYQRTGNDAYRQECMSINQGLLTPYNQGASGAGTAGGLIPTGSGYTADSGCFAQWSDPWTDGSSVADYCREVLTLPGVDDSGVTAGYIRNTAFNIAQSREVTKTIHGITYTGLYTADWAGNLSSPATAGLIAGFNSFEAAYEARTSSNGNAQEAGACSIMTSTSSSCVLIGADVCSRWAQNSGTA